ncbi:AMP-binding protein [Rhizobium sp. C4]|uniref:AMP-binding protein n=1 Tax=Rhizobium sp. C4 TaxID=1349800 RepID=UPI001E55731A|nr:AMP-binding protein [Rhizobium sp. C4]MCD2174859.1 AMP-binding protein [Rhizobium sp. C4]
MPIASLSDIERLEETPAHEVWARGSVYEQIARIAERSPQKVAIRSLLSGAADAAVETVTYDGLLKRIHAMAHLFRQCGVERADAVAMLLPGVPDAFAAMVGAHLAGRANPVNFLQEPGHIAALLKAAGARVLLVPDASILPGIIDKLPAVLAAFDAPLHVFRIGGPAEGAVKRIDEALSGLPQERPAFWNAPAPHEAAALFHTGGTTSTPKLAVHTHGGITRHCWALSSAWCEGEDEVMFNGLPPFHVGGGYAAGLMPLTQGAEVVLMTPAGFRNRDVIANFWRHVERFRPTIVAMVPTSWSAVMNVPLEAADISSLRLCHAAGAAMPVETARQVEQRTGRRIVEGWGMTELHGFGAMNPAKGDSRIGSVGFPLPFTEIMVAKVEAGAIAHVCAPEEVGHVLVRGEQVFGGYLDPAHNESAWYDPLPNETRPGWSKGGRWFDTGDLGRKDAEGYLWLTGRSKDIIIRGGHNIDPLAIEEALYRHPAVELAAAVGQPDAYAGELPVAFVQLRAGQEADAEALRAFCAERIAERAAVPVAVRIIPAMPLTAVGKIFKPALREAAAVAEVRSWAGDMLGTAVTVTAHHDKRHGLLLTIRPPAGTPAATLEALKQRLAAYHFASEIDSPA